jgi:hypothetical protein
MYIINLWVFSQGVLLSLYFFVHGTKQTTLSTFSKLFPKFVLSDNFLFSSYVIYIYLCGCIPKLRITLSKGWYRRAASFFGEWQKSYKNSKHRVIKTRPSQQNKTNIFPRNNSLLMFWTRMLSGCFSLWSPKFCYCYVVLPGHLSQHAKAATAEAWA